MKTTELDLNLIFHEFDWEGNNAAFTCPPCGKVFIVSELLHPKGRECPNCQKSVGHVKGGRKSGGRAYIEFEK
jgi:predicted RNA-binding Zn-ribbon protein involved in translation (DUF1610 family)